MEKLFQALAKFQAEASQPRKNGKNPLLKSRYTKLEDIIECIAEVGPNNGLSHYSKIVKEDGEYFCVTVLAHSSGQFIEDKIPLLFDKKMQVPMQALGSCVSYARRFSLQNLYNLAGKEDDDAEALRQPIQQQQRPVQQQQRPIQQQQRPIQQQQRPIQQQQRPVQQPNSNAMPNMQQRIKF